MALLFMFRPMTLKQLKSLTSIDIFSCLGGLEVTHKTAVRKFKDLIPGSGKDICCCCVFTFLSKTHYLSRNSAIPFAMLI